MDKGVRKACSFRAPVEQRYEFRALLGSIVVRALAILLCCIFSVVAGCNVPADNGPSAGVVPPFVTPTDQPARIDPVEPTRLTRAVLDRSLELGTEFLLNSQREAGNFAYTYNFVRRRDLRGDNQVRQAGALWSLTLIHHDKPSKATADALLRGLAFFRRHSTPGPDGRLIPMYPETSSGKTGTVALLVLTHVDALRSELPADDRSRLTADMKGYLKLMLSLRREDGLFAGSYDKLGAGRGNPSPYSDGEALLAMIKAARYADQGQLRPIILRSAIAMHETYVEQALRRDPDSPLTKGFYQWGTMSYYELHSAGWSGDEAWARRAIQLAHWMIDVHRTLRRRRNTAYACEGLICAAELARLVGDRASAAKISRVVDLALAKLTGWQVGGPMPNKYLRAHPTQDPRAVGGVMNGRSDPRLRIDVTQHQMHAVILARRFLYKK